MRRSECCWRRRLIPTIETLALLLLRQDAKEDAESLLRATTQALEAEASKPALAAARACCSAKAIAVVPTWPCTTVLCWRG